MPNVNKKNGAATPFPFVFFGSPQFAVDVLLVLLERHTVPLCIVTTPDRPAGRGKVLTPTPVKRFGIHNNIPVLEPETLDDSFLDLLQHTTGKPLVGVLAAYGALIPKKLLHFFPRGILNIHPSLLPSFRGSSPVQAQILADDPDAVGVSVMVLDEKMDHGPIIAARKVRTDTRGIAWPPTAPALASLLGREGAHALADLLPDWLNGRAKAAEQDHSKATYTRKIVREDGRIDLTEIERDPRGMYVKFCAYTPWPGLFFFTERNGQRIRVKITAASFQHNAFVIERIIPENGSEIPYNAFWRQ